MLANIGPSVVRPVVISLTRKISKIDPWLLWKYRPKSWHRADPVGALISFPDPQGETSWFEIKKKNVQIYVGASIALPMALYKYVYDMI